jgi:phenylalanyl-tRNA synthetase alpha chain
METRRPPVRIIVPGRVFRHEATDAGHETTFYQLEGFAIDKNVRVTDLVGTLKSFLGAVFGEVETRVRPHYYPFVEPGMDIDMRCLICGGVGCSVCKHSGWLEMLGSGMIHPAVLEEMRVDPKQWNGFAFGLGIDRLIMNRYGIADIRTLYENDLRFLRQF